MNSDLSDVFSIGASLPQATHAELDPEISANIDAWTKLYQEEHSDYAQLDSRNDEITFSEIYHTLVNSTALDTLLQLENSSAIAVKELYHARENAREIMQKKHEQERKQAFSFQKSDQNINQMTLKHTQDREAMEIRWESEITQLTDNQKREYREFVLNLHEEMLKEQMSPTTSIKNLNLNIPNTDNKNSGGASPKKSKNEALSSILETVNPTFSPPAMFSAENRMQESFTIHLGAQLKTSHNIRILHCDTFDLCHHAPTSSSNGDTPLAPARPSPERLQTALSLYSSRLCGQIILVDGFLSTYSAPTEEFNRICNESIDFHFPTLEMQLQNISGYLPTIAKQRAPSPKCEDEEKSQTPYDPKSLTIGDIYITRHSNLAEIHVIFHLVTSDDVNCSDLPSRHPILSGLRNAISIAFERDIQCLTVPLLLVNQMQPDMTVGWCIRRAELILKCIKGFILENSHFSGLKPRTIQFLVPREVSKEMFDQFCSMIPNIFRISNSMTLKV